MRCEGWARTHSDLFCTAILRPLVQDVELNFKVSKASPVPFSGMCAGSWETALTNTMFVGNIALGFW